MKRILTLLLALSLLALTGCDFISFSVDELLTAPSIADEQTAIYNALIAHTGKGIKLEYPVLGDNHSAFIFGNIDKDEDEEALAFYSFSGEDNVHMCILERAEDGSWRATYEATGDGDVLDRVYINNVNGLVDIIIGYGRSGFADGTMVIYRVHEGSLLSLNESTYTILEIEDMDGNGRVEIIITNKVGMNTVVTVITNPDGVNYTTHPAVLGSSALSIANHTFGSIDENRKAFFLDIVEEDGYTYTELLYLTEDGLVCPTSGVVGMREATQRPIGYNSVDYDGDGRVELPLTEPFIGYTGVVLSRAQLMTVWMNYDAERVAFTREAYSYYSANGRYVFKLPNRWVGFVSVVEDTETGEITFVKYDNSAMSIQEMLPIMSLKRLSDSSELEEHLDKGYQQIAATDYGVYLVRTLAEEKEPLVLTNDEIRNNFYTIH